MFEIHLPPTGSRDRKSFRSLLRNWCGGAPKFLLLISLLVAIFMVLPLVNVLMSGMQADLSRWMKLLDVRIPKLLWNTLSLASTVTFFGLLIGFSLSWLTVRSDIPAKKHWQWLVALPMLIPSYVGAMCYISVFGPRGLIKDLLGYSPLDIYGFFGAAFVLTVFTYPYVYLIASAALKKINMNFEEVGLSKGLTYLEVFFRIVMQIMRPALGAGGILVFLYALSDFGTVAMLRYTTFTSAIYFHIGSFDQNTASVLSTVLIITTLILLYFESKTREKQEFYQVSGAYRKAKIIPLGKWKWPAFLMVSLLFFISTVVPVCVLIYWSIQGISQGAINMGFWSYAFNSFYLSFSAAILCIIFSLPVIYLSSRYPSKVSLLIEKAAYIGFSLPGVIVALGIIFIFNQYVPFLYNTAALVALAYIIRFLPKAMQAEGSALKLLSPRLDEAGKSLGCTSWQVMRKIIFPIIFPGILVAGALVFVSSIKELPVTLLLRPPGMDTLAIRIWTEASEYYYFLAAPPALLLVLISALPLKWLLNKY